MLLWPFNKYPGTDYETYNWEWLLDTVKKWNKRLEDFFENNGIHDYVEGILQEHPEWVTTVMDGSISESKLVPRFLQSVLNPFVTPQMFGAVGDGVTDDYQAFQDAIDYAADHNNYVFVPAGTYIVNDVLKLPYHRNDPGYWYGNGVRLIGANMGKTVIKKSAQRKMYNNIDTLIYLYCADDENDDIDATGTGVEIAHLTLNNESGADGSYVIYGNASRSHFHDLTLVGDQGIYDTAGFTNTFENIWFNVSIQKIICYLLS